MNATNTPHFNNPGSTYGNASFGEVQSAQADERTIQFAIKLTF